MLLRSAAIEAEIAQYMVPFPPHNPIPMVGKDGVNKAAVKQFSQRVELADKSFVKSTQGCLSARICSKILCCTQEMEHILEHIKSSRLVDNNQPDDFDHEPASTESGDDTSAAEDEATGDELSAKPKKQKRLQTMVFSATLTLPQHLRKRFKKGKPSYFCFTGGILPAGSEL